MSPSSLHGCTCSVSRPQAMVSFRMRAQCAGYSGLSRRARGPIRITPFSNAKTVARLKGRDRGLRLRPYGDTDVAVERTWTYLQRVAATGHGRVQVCTPQTHRPGQACLSVPVDRYE